AADRRGRLLRRLRALGGAGGAGDARPFPLFHPPLCRPQPHHAVRLRGPPPLERGRATPPTSLCLSLLSPPFGRLASGVGPRLPMTVGPIVAGAGMLLLARLDPEASYVTDVLAAVPGFGLGMSMTVAPLPATVLASVAPNRVGIASGVNNGVSRVAGLLAIAVLGAVISAHFGARLDGYLDGHKDHGFPPTARETRAT